MTVVKLLSAKTMRFFKWSSITYGRVDGNNVTRYTKKILPDLYKVHIVGLGKLDHSSLGKKLTIDMYHDNSYIAYVG